MTRLNLIILFSLLLAACSSDDKYEQPILVTDIVMPTQGTVFNPGDKVTISAQGFQADDEIMLSIYWPLPDEPIQEGYAKGVYAVVTEKTATKITFLAPGHYPASTTEILLRRSGDMMSLGKISVADGQSPKEYQLYGIINSHSNTNRNYAIEHVRIDNGSVGDVNLLTENQDFSCVVNRPGSGMLCGLLTQDDRRTLGIYDLSMNYWAEQNITPIDVVGMAVDNSILTASQHADRLYVNRVSTSAYTRMNVPEKDPSFKLPEGLKAESMSRYPFIEMSDKNVLFSADNGDGTFSPVVLDGSSAEKESSIYVGEPVQAVAMIPFWIVKPVEGMGTTKYTRIGGYIVSRGKNAVAVGEHKTELRLWNSLTKTLEEPFATFANEACSVTTLISADYKTQELHILFDANRNGRLIEVYDWLKQDWRSPGLSGFSYSEIVLGR